ncbi:MAG TPA: DUF6114 domain-containing protein [Streptosporangiaceae bacterium]|nr:DUF6114 domain-containing protein [Streptosporangiaceae bacterium]
MLPADGDLPDLDADGREPATSPEEPGASPEEYPSAGTPTPLGEAWRSAADWRRSRPFWGGVFLIAAGAELLLIPLPEHSLGLIMHVGTGGVLGILIGALLIACAFLLWFQPQHRVFYSIVAVLLAIAALVASNLGGFIVGTILGVLGGSLGFAWSPADEDEPDDEDARHRPAGHAGGSFYRAMPLLPMMLVLAGPAGGPAVHGADRLTASQGPAGIIPLPLPSIPPILPSLGPPGPSPSASGSPSPSPGASTSPGTAQKNPQARAAGLVTAAEPATITADSATLTGLHFDGVATVQTASGPERVLKFTMSGLSLKNGDLTVNQDGRAMAVQAASFTFSGHVTLLTTKFSGSLLGVPLSFSPKLPPPAVLNVMTFTNVTSDQPFTSADSFQVGGLRITSGRLSRA